MIITHEKEQAIQAQLEKVNQNLKAVEAAFPLKETQELFQSLDQLLSLVKELGGYDGDPHTHPDRSRCEFNMWHDSHYLSKYIKNQVHGMYGMGKDAERYVKNIQRWIEENHQYDK